MISFKSIVVATHTGRHHVDELMAASILSLWAAPRRVKIVRSRDAHQVAVADYALDVGEDYDPARGRFDHHMTDTSGLPSGRWRSRGYATAGLVWRRFGRSLIRRRLHLSLATGRNHVPRLRIEPEIVPFLVETTFFRIDKAVMAPVDEWDNGVHEFSGNVIPIQALIHAIPFSRALAACREFLRYSVDTTTAFGYAQMTLADRFNEPGEPETWFVSGDLVVVVSGKRLDYRVVREAVKKRFKDTPVGLLGVINPTSDGRFVLTLRDYRVALEQASYLRSKFSVDLFKDGQRAFSDSSQSLIESCRHLVGAKGSFHAMT